MPVLLEALLLVLAFFWFAITTVASLLFLPIILIIKVLLGDPPSRSTSTTTPYTSVDLDHHVHVPLEKVPPQYYTAYNAYVRSPEWRTFRKLVLKRDKYHCVDCNDYDIPLQVHHIHYDGVESMTFTLDQCVSVCHTCHAIRHGRDRI